MRIARIALVACAAAALAVSLPATAFGAGDGAVAAKKGCKKGKGKKKGCKKKKKKQVVLPAPVVRGTLTWSGMNVDLDLHSFDAEGRHTGLGATPGSIDASIPNSSFSGDDRNTGDSSGLESFTDNVFVRGGSANREFAYLACFYNNSAATFTGVMRNGQVSTLPLNANAGQGIAITAPGGPPVPATFSC